MASKRSKSEILQGAADTLRTAKLGLADLSGNDVARRMPGLRNVATFGHATTQAIQNLRGPVGRDIFNAWYGPYEAQMRADQLMKYFWDLRSRILKEGHLGHIGSEAEVRTSLELIALIDRERPLDSQPFVLDEFGGSGWFAKLSDGTYEPYYVDYPEGDYATMTFHFADPPTVHLGKTLIDTSVGALAGHYLAYLSQLLSNAHKHFS